MNNKAHLRPKDFDSNGDIIPMSWKEEKGDLISREALKKAINELPNDNPSYYYTGDLLDRERVLDEIDNAPNVEVFTKEDMAGAYNEGYACGSREYKRPQGEWLFDKENSFTIDMYRCSICGYFGHTHFKFCPNCGADMRGVE